ncbi:MAG: gamma-glutamylcyclotransferase [Pseudomonadota bacterium]
MSVTREKLSANKYAEEAKEVSGVTVLTEAERDATRLELLNEMEAGEDVWVFAYGSLIWNPAFHFAEKCQGRLYGYHRSFCLYSYFARGTPAIPGLALALDRGGSCQGMLFRIASDLVDSETKVIWAREMFSGIYRPLWVRVRTGTGTTRAITFVAERKRQNYTGALPLKQQAQIIARAQGQLGSCTDYLTATVACLEELNIHDQGLSTLNKLVKSIS